ncbi:hypothetical protein [Glaciibacter superstes]|uniref:hypothetical protein n=1 Tax=Glaciibacter superstes TaxID=501023 RepID=UPI0003B44894|nr:hypothetical protein [Glaciibacter superstes]
MNDSRLAWYDRTLNATVVGGVVVFAVTWFVPWAISEATKAKAPAWAYLVVAGVALIVASLVVPPWRRLIWNNVAKDVKWFFAIRPITRRKKELLEQAGYDRRSGEVAAERTSVPQPSWRIDARDAFGERNVHWLNNQGYAVTDVALSCNPEFFALDGDVFWKGTFGSDSSGGSIGSWFKGVTTERGRTEGVTFGVT